jgi:hypothetical protein
MPRFVTALALAGLIFASVVMEANSEEKKPKYTIKQVMAKAMRGGLCAKVASGKASDDEKATLVAMFVALGENKPPKGEADSWKDKTTALVDAAKAGDGAKLKKAATCAACHSLHKGK